MQPEAEQERDTIISWWLVTAIVLSVAWAVLGAYVLTRGDPSPRVPGNWPFDHNPQIALYLAIAAAPVLPGFLAAAAVVLVWLAFVRAEWSEPALFSSAMILTGTVFLGGIDTVTARYAGHAYSSSIISAVVVAYGTWLTMAYTRKKPVFAALCLCALAFAAVFAFISGATVIQIAGGALLGCAILAFGGYICERVGVNPLIAQ